MSTAIRHNLPSPQVTRNEVCFRTPVSSDVQHGFLLTTYMGEKEIARRLESFAGVEVPTFELCACPVQIGQQIENRQIRVMKDRVSLGLAYAVSSVNPDGSVSTNYTNIDGTPYTGDVSLLDIITDGINFNAPVVFCEAGVRTVTRTDVWNEAQHLVAIIWQDMLGTVIPEPPGQLMPGSCEVPLDTEIIPLIDNLFENGHASGRYTPFWQINLYDSQGRVWRSNPTLADGVPYTPQGQVTSEPIVPPIKSRIARITNGQSWEITNQLIQSAAWAIEVANPLNSIDIAVPGDPLFQCFSIHYDGEWSVDGDRDSFLETGLKITANGEASAVVSWSEQPLLIEVAPVVTQAD